MRRHIHLAYDRKEDWDRFIRSIDARESMDNTWEEWHQNFLKTITDLILRGFEVKDIPMDIDKLTQYCRKKGITRRKSPVTICGGQSAVDILGPDLQI